MEFKTEIEKINGYTINDLKAREEIEKIKDSISNGLEDLNGQVPNSITEIMNLKNNVEELNSQYNTINSTKADKTTTNNLQQQVNNLVLGAVGEGNNAEVIQARENFVTLNSRLDAICDNLDLTSEIIEIKYDEKIEGKKIGVNTEWNLGSFDSAANAIIYAKNVSVGDKYIVSGVNGNDSYNPLVVFGNGINESGDIKVTGYVTNIGEGTGTKKVVNYSVIVPANTTIMYVIGYSSMQIPIIQQNKMSYKIKNNSKMSCFIKNNKIIVGTKYNSNYDLWKSIEIVGNNNLPMISKLYKIQNSNKYVDINLFDDSTSPFIENGSDFIGPYNGLRSLDNSDGVFTDSWEWAGGNHCLTYNNNKLKTAINKEFTFVVNNVETTNYIGDAQSIKVKIVNDIFGVNTIKEDNSAQVVLTETIIYSFNTNGEINIDVEIECKQNCCCTTYHGLQMEVPTYYTKGLFVDDDTNKQYFSNIYGTQVMGGKYKEGNTCREIKYKNDNNEFCKMWVDGTYGLGLYKLMTLEDAIPCKHSEYNKGYLWLIPKYVEFKKGDIIKYRGGYNWYYNEL